MKKLLALFVFLTLACLSVKAYTIDVLPVSFTNTKEPNRVWAGTFQLVWNDLADNFGNGKITFDFNTPEIAKQLNKQSFKADMLSSDSYYKTWGKADLNLKKQIERDLLEKFNEKSDILDSFDWKSGKYLFYAMLKKDFEFLNPFDKLDKEKFGKNKTKVSYFGINRHTKKMIRENVNVIFYDSPEKFAVSLNTKTDDIVYLYRTDDNKNFDKLYNDMIKKGKNYSAREFLAKDELKVPEISLYTEKTFDKLKNKRVKGTDIVISEAIETIDFKMDNKGVELKSEAGILAKMSLAPAPEITKPRFFYCDDTFVLFLQEKGKDKPYFALRVNDVAELNKTGRK